MERFKNIGKKLLFPHWAVILLLCTASCVFLVLIFLNGYAESWFSYPVYVLSAYALTVACIKFVPGIVCWAKSREDAKALLTTEENERQFRSSLNQGVVFNLLFALFNLVSGILYRSVWLGSSGLYYLVLAVIHIVLLRFERKLDNMEDDVQKHRSGWNCFRLCGILLLLLHLTMTGIVFQRIWQGRIREYPGFLIFAVAAMIFYKLIVAIIRVVQLRKRSSPVLGAARNISLSEALMSLFSLQTAMIGEFGTDMDFQLLMNSLTGGAVCLLAMLGALGMILHGSNKLKEYRRKH